MLQSMRRVLVGAVLAGLLASPALAAPMGFDQARNLLSRTGFGPTPDEIAAFQNLDYAQGVERILDGARTRAETPLPSWMNESLADLQLIRREKRTVTVTVPNSASASGVKKEIPEVAKIVRGQEMDAKAWWYQEMLTTPSPFTERMVLFWHNHFTSSVQKVRYIPAMVRQNELFRREAVGNFGRLLHEVGRDPAMLIYLDGATSRKGHPNENFARELMELFTLGEGHYTEKDVKEAARAFTGWSLDRQTGLERTYPGLHDNGVKTFLGQTGNFDGDQIIDIILQQPRTAEFVVEKLWREFVSPAPDAAEVRRLAAVFRDSNYEMKPLLRAMFLSQVFRDPANRGVLFKSPVELIVGTLRFLRIPVENKTKLVQAGRLLGQDILAPPNVKGWPGGEAWITSYSLIERQQILRRVVQATQVASMDRMGMRADREQLPVEGRSMRNVPMEVRMPSGSGDYDVAALEKIMLPIAPLTPVPADEPAGVAMARLMLDPVYQLK